MCVSVYAYIYVCVCGYVCVCVTTTVHWKKPETVHAFCPKRRARPAVAERLAPLEPLNPHPRFGNLSLNPRLGPKSSSRVSLLVLGKFKA